MIKNQKIANTIADGVVEVLQSKKVLNLLGLVVEYLQERLKELKVVVITPRKLTLLEEKKVKKMIQRLVQNDNVIYEYRIDSKLIDGLKIVAHDKKWDFSLASQLASLNKN